MKPKWTRAQGTHGGNEHFARRELAEVDSGYQVWVQPPGIHTVVQPSDILSRVPLQRSTYTGIEGEVGKRAVGKKTFLVLGHTIADLCVWIYLRS